MSFLIWLESTGLSSWIRGAPTLWAFPFILFLHTLGLAIVGGLSVALNIWVLGFSRSFASAALAPFFRIVWIGFTINLVSGLLLLIAYPTKALTDGVFYLKLALVAAALGQIELLRRQVFVAGRAPAQPSIRASAATALVLWAGAVLTGRLLAYTYNYLTAASLAAGL